MKFIHAISTLLLVLLNNVMIHAQLGYWQGVGIGDSHMEIDGTILICNGPDLSESYYLIDSISNGVINCHRFVQETGEFKNFKKFTYSENLDTIKGSYNSQPYQFYNLNNPNNHEDHNISKITYSIYNYSGSLNKEYVITSFGELNYRDKHKSEILEIYNKEKVNLLFNNLSILDLDNFVQSEKNFFQISHAPCHCLKIEYNENSTLSYCRQEPNKYIKNVMKQIKNL